MLVPALARCAQLAWLHLVLPFLRDDDARRAELWDIGWQRTLAAVRGLLEGGSPLRVMITGVPASLEAATRGWQAPLQAAAAAGTRTIRTTVLLGLHPRAGRCSLLNLLPLEVLRQVLELAAPMCAFQLRTQVVAFVGPPANAPNP